MSNTGLQAHENGINNQHALSVGTVIDAGFPHALAAILCPLIPVYPYVLSASGRPESWKNILESHSFLILGDLPTSPEEDCNGNCPLLRNWLEKGGRLLYFSGWRDYHFLRNNDDLFGVKVAHPGPTTDSSLKPIKWCITSPPTPTPPAGIRYLYNATEVTGKVILSTNDDRPVVIEKSVGEGKVVISLGPISFPSAVEWIRWDGFTVFISWALDLPSQLPASKIDRNIPSAISKYSSSLTLWIANNNDITSRVIEDVLYVKGENLVLAAEMCQFLRLLGQANGDRLTVLMAWRLLLDIWNRLCLVNTYDYAPFQLHWYKMRQLLDSAWYDDVDLLDTIKKAKEQFRTHETARKLYANTLPDQGISSILDGLSYVAEAISGTLSAPKVIEMFELAINVLDKADAASFPHVKPKAINTCLKLAMKLLPGPVKPESPAQRDHIDDLRSQATELARRSIESEFVKSVSALVSAIDEIRNFDEPAAWQTLSFIRDRWIKGVMDTVMRLRQALQLDPLCYISDFFDCSSKQRVRLTRQLVALSRLKIEGEPICLTWVVTKDADNIHGVIKNTLLDIDLMDENAPREIASVSRIWPTLICDQNLRIHGAIEAVSGSLNRTQLEGRKTAYLRRLLSDSSRGSIFTISSRTGTIRIRNSDGSGVDYTKGDWRLVNAVGIQYLNEILGGVFCKKSLCSLVCVMGDLQTIGDEGRCGFHGTSFVAFEGTEPSSLNSGKVINPGLKLTTTEDALAGICADDGALVLRLSDGTWTKKNLKLHSSKTSEEVVLEKHSWLNARGTRHKSAVAFSYENKDVAIFILSQDGGCLVAKAGDVWSLW